MVSLMLPTWLEWLGSPTVCTIIGAVGILATVASIILGLQNSNLRQQIKNIQGGPQQQASQGAQQQQQTIQQNTGNVVTHNYYGPVYTTETKGETSDAGTD